MRRALVRRLRRWLYIGHRWIGIATCLLFAMWFVSGIVMTYVAFPHLTAQERVAALPDLDWSKVAVTPDRALATAGLKSYPREFRLDMLNDEPVYRVLGWDGARRVVSARDGRIIDRIAQDEALAVARRYPAAGDVRMIGTVDRDQWSVTARFDPLRPLFLIALGDAAGTQLYVSEKSGEIVLDTTRTERVWNWLGSIPHWIYPTILRKDGPLWREVVLWISGVCMVLAVSGIWIGILRVRLRRRYWRNSISPYRGWMAWHHVTGFFAGVFVLTWMFSGWLSLNPGGFFAGRGASREMTQRYAGHATPDIVAEFDGRPLAPLVEARFVWLGGRPLMIGMDRANMPRVFDAVSGASLTLDDKQIFAAARHLMPEAEMTMRRRLTSEDAYWYSHHENRVLPVLRAGFNDDVQSWFHIDPRTGDILGRSDTSRRTYRWLFNALHSLDFHALIAHRPAWDIVVWLLSLLGLVISTSGIVIGWRRLMR
ncbi:MAG: PepSY domain-containing protein [Proteobacteria bacterium]|nr:PepSY domain-containing protein [Pseudomonadota bacterium]